MDSSVDRTASDAVAGALPASISGSEHRTGKRVRAPVCKDGGDWGIGLAGKQEEAGG